MLRSSIRPASPSELPEIVATDDEAMDLYRSAGVELGLSDDHPFAVAERGRWRRSVERGSLFVAVESERIVGFASLDCVDDEPYLDQLSVRASAARRGIGRALLREAVAWGRAQSGGGVALTTYRHVPFNGPFYASEGFVFLPEDACGPGIHHHLDEQRRWLPFPEQRVAMRRPLP